MMSRKSGRLSDNNSKKSGKNFLDQQQAILLPRNQ